jgi:hypothetical protein
MGSNKIDVFYLTFAFNICHFFVSFPLLAYFFSIFSQVFTTTTSSSPWHEIEIILFYYMFITLHLHETILNKLKNKHPLKGERGGTQRED